MTEWFRRRTSDYRERYVSIENPGPTVLVINCDQRNDPSAHSVTCLLVFRNLFNK